LVPDSIRAVPCPLERAGGHDVQAVWRLRPGHGQEDRGANHHQVRGSMLWSISQSFCPFFVEKKMAVLRNSMLWFFTYIVYKLHIFLTILC
jgi:hypothetical protein